LVDTSSDTQLSPQLKSNPIAKQSSSSDKPTEYYLPSLFSEKSESSTGTSGEERSMSLPGASRVRTFQLLVEALGLQENGRAFGEKWRELSVKYNPDTHSWKTHQCSLLEGLDEFSETWPKWGMMQNGVCWERIIAERPTNETESGFWRSPDTGQGGTSGLLKKGLNKRANGQPIQIRLVDQVNNPRFWPTPAARDHKGANSLHHVTVAGGGAQAHGSTSECREIRNSAVEGLEITSRESGSLEQPGSQQEPQRSDWWATEPALGRVANGVARRVDRLKAIGNGQVPIVAATAWRILTWK
jgi:hypothetical protein